jgi:SAM-dependent methyltransferase
MTTRSRAIGLRTLKLGVRYFANRFSMAAAHEGYRAAASSAARDLAIELRKLPRVARLAMSSGLVAYEAHPTGYSEAIVESLTRLPVNVRPYRIDVGRFHAHVDSFGYPRMYAAGPLAEGGNRENKLLEYFISLELLNLNVGQVIIDIASEHSIFPAVVRLMREAEVFRQDLIYPDGIHGDRIGGNAAAMPVADQFADALVLHNSFEHFEGTADMEFVSESWRVLKPGGTVLIVPLFVSDRYTIITDPLTDQRGVAWDAGARVVELPGWHNRFGRFYDAPALERRVLSPAREIGYELEILRVVNLEEIHPLASTHFALVMRKPSPARAR